MRGRCPLRDSVAPATFPGTIELPRSRHSMGGDLRTARWARAAILIAFAGTLACATAGGGRPASPGAAEWTRTLDLQGAQVAFRDEGRAAGEEPPWVLVHGLGGSMEDFAELRERASRSRRVLSFDLPGFGQSSNPQQDYRVVRYAQLLDGFLAIVGATPAHLICHSLGGQVCIAFALEHPSLVASLTLIDTAGTYERTEWARWEVKRAARMNLGKLDVRFFPGVATLNNDRHPILQRIVGGDPMVLAALDSIQRNLHQRVRHLESPTLIIWGVEDPVFSVFNAFYLRENIAGSELRLVEGAGHLPFASHPDLVEKWIAAFQARTGPVAPSQGTAP